MAAGGTTRPYCDEPQSRGAGRAFLLSSYEPQWTNPAHSAFKVALKILMKPKSHNGSLY